MNIELKIADKFFTKDAHPTIKELELKVKQREMLLETAFKRADF